MKKFLALAAAAVLVGAGCNADVDIRPAPAPAPTPKPAEEARIDGEAEQLTVTMKAENFSYDPKVITALPGQKVEVNFSAVTGFHDFVIDGVVSMAIAAGKVVSFTAPTVPGSYPFYCSIGSHRTMGMEGTLIVK